MASGFVASNAIAPGATGEEIAFSPPAEISAPQLRPLVCELEGVGEGVLICGVFEANMGFQDCYGDWDLGSSHLCDGIVVTAVRPA